MLLEGIFQVSLHFVHLWTTGQNVLYRALKYRILIELPNKILKNSYNWALSIACALKCFHKWCLPLVTGAVVSGLVQLSDIEENYLQAELGHCKTISVLASTPFNWYLHEESLEVRGMFPYLEGDGHGIGGLECWERDGVERGIQGAIEVRGMSHLLVTTGFLWIQNSCQL